ncbi:unnamed protein product [Amoebophrya sp. A25]|nr:unnamed protein product [Amoebophrya sp. A25]|eukprot:GSA25T00012453001.1
MNKHILPRTATVSASCHAWCAAGVPRHIASGALYHTAGRSSNYIAGRRAIIPVISNSCALTSRNFFTKRSFATDDVCSASSTTTTTTSSFAVPKQGDADHAQEDKRAIVPQLESGAIIEKQKQDESPTQAKTEVPVDVVQEQRTDANEQDSSTHSHPGEDEVLHTGKCSRVFYKDAYGFLIPNDEELKKTVASKDNNKGEPKLRFQLYEMAKGSKIPRIGDDLQFRVGPGKKNPNFLEAFGVSGGTGDREWITRTSNTEEYGAKRQAARQQAEAASRKQFEWGAASVTYKGVCKAISVRKSIGFISPDDKSLHEYSESRDGDLVFPLWKIASGSKIPLVGDVLEFRIQPDPVKPHLLEACDVTGGTGDREWINKTVPAIYKASRAAQERDARFSQKAITRRKERAGEKTYTGVCKSVFRDNKYGFIQPDDAALKEQLKDEEGKERDISFSLWRGGGKWPRQGEKVEFCVKRNPRQPQFLNAYEVTVAENDEGVHDEDNSPDTDENRVRQGTTSGLQQQRYAQQEGG